MTKSSPDEAIKTAAIKNVREQLRDPESAQFSKWEIFPLQKGACGEVNAKNGFGGYSGKTVFSYAGGDTVVADDERLSQLDVKIACMKLRNNEYRLSHADERAARMKRQAERAKAAQ